MNKFFKLKKYQGCATEELDLAILEAIYTVDELQVFLQPCHMASVEAKNRMIVPTLNYCEKTTIKLRDHAQRE